MCVGDDAGRACCGVQGERHLEQSGCWGMHGASLRNGDEYVNRMNAVGLPMPGMKGERHVAIGAYGGENVACVGWQKLFFASERCMCKRAGEVLNSLSVVFAVILCS